MASPSTLRRIAAHYTWSAHCGWMPRAILSFDPEGRLVSIDTDVTQIDALERVEFYSGILVPGFVNAHCHLELSYLKGLVPRGTGLAGFVNRISEKRHAASPEERVQAADAWDARMRQEGIVGVADICNDTSTFPLKQKSGIYYHNFVELYGIDPAVAGNTFLNGAETARNAENRGLAYSITPHSTYSLSEPLFEQIIRENANRKPLSIHFMESPDEAALFRNKGAFAERYRNLGLHVDFTPYGSPAGRLIETLPGDTPLLLIHNTFVAEEDIDRIQNHFRDVAWVVCPRSNDYIEGTFPPVDLLRKKGCRIALGTDSLSSNDSLSLLDEWKYLSEKQGDLKWDEMLRWSTINGAEALGITDWAGSFEIGKRPGAVLIDHIGWDTMSLTPESTARRIV